MSMRGGRSSGHSIGGGATPAPTPRHHDRRTTLLWTLAIGLFIIVVLGVIGAVANGNSNGNDEGGALIVLAVVLVLALALARAARRRSRRNPTPARADGATGAMGAADAFGAPPSWRRLGSPPPIWGPIPPPPPADGRRRFRRSRPRDPRLAVLIIFVLFLAAGGAAIGDFRDAQRSSYTQHHGIRISGLIQHKNNDVDCNRGCSDTFSASVLLSSPVDGHQSTTLHGQGRLTGGDLTTVLVDPHDPSYAELPGDKLHAALSWLGYALGALFFLAILLLVIYAVGRRYFGPGPQPRPAGPRPQSPDPPQSS